MFGQHFEHGACLVPSPSLGVIGIPQAMLCCMHRSLASMKSNGELIWAHLHRKQPHPQLKMTIGVRRAHVDLVYLAMGQNESRGDDRFWSILPFANGIQEGFFGLRIDSRPYNSAGAQLPDTSLDQLLMGLRHLGMARPQRGEGGGEWEILRVLDEPPSCSSGSFLHVYSKK